MNFDGFWSVSKWTFCVINLLPFVVIPAYIIINPLIKESHKASISLLCSYVLLRYDELWLEVELKYEGFGLCNRGYAPAMFCSRVRAAVAVVLVPTLDNPDQIWALKHI